MSNLTVLRRYAQKSHPETLPSSELLAHTPTSLTLFDAFPKSIFHFLILPRITPPLTVFDLANLWTLLKCDREHAKKLLAGLEEDAKVLREMIEDEMMRRYGFKWGIWTGFHGAPSMEHVHLHVLSADLCSEKMKHKKHYNSFHPKLGFFLHLEEVMSWFDAEPSYFETVSQLKRNQYEPILKEDLSCWRCGHVMKNMPTLKAHLEEEWDKEAKTARARLERKRKQERSNPNED
jgi:aprataxin